MRIQIINGPLLEARFILIEFKAMNRSILLTFEKGSSVYPSEEKG